MNEKCLCGRADLDWTCGRCQRSCCKKCIEFLPSDAFSFMREIPEELGFSQYCLTCFATQIQPALKRYRQTMKMAEEVIIIDTPQRRPLKILKKLEEPLTVVDCPDREKTILRLGFLAAELGFNSVIKAQITFKKVRNEGYQKMMWQGKGIAANLVPPK